MFRCIQHWWYNNGFGSKAAFSLGSWVHSLCWLSVQNWSRASSWLRTTAPRGRTRSGSVRTANGRLCWSTTCCRVTITSDSSSPRSVVAKIPQISAKIPQISAKKLNTYLLNTFINTDHCHKYLLDLFNNFTNIDQKILQIFTQKNLTDIYSYITALFQMFHDIQWLKSIK